MPKRESMCELVRTGKMPRKGNPVVEFYKNGEPQYYCYGYIDLMDDEPLEECKYCPKFHVRAEEDLQKWLEQEAKDEAPR